MYFNNNLYFNFTVILSMKHVKIIILALTLMLVTYDYAHAYIDPSTGSYILQLVLAGLLGALFTLKIFWKKIKLAIVRLFSKNNQVESHDRR